MTYALLLRCEFVTSSLCMAPSAAGYLLCDQFAYSACQAFKLPIM